MQNWVRDLNKTLQTHPALYQNDVDWQGFEWIDCSDSQQSVISFLRYSQDSHQCVLVVCNFTPVVRYDYRVGVPSGDRWIELLNSDAECYGGSNVGNSGGLYADHYSSHAREYSLNLTLPPLGLIFLTPEE